MRYKRKRLLLLKQKHYRIMVAIAVALVLIAVVYLIVSATGREAQKKNSVEAVAEKGVINIGLRGNILSFCTYNEETGRYEGFEADVADEIVRRLFGDDSIIVNYIDVDSETRTARLQRGEIDIALGTAVSIKESGVSYTSPYFSEGSAFLVMKDKVSHIEGLSGGTIGVVQGSIHALPSEEDKTKKRMDEYLKILEINARVKVYASYPEAVSALRDGFVKAVCASETNLKLFGRSDMLVLPERFMPNGYCVCVRDSLGAFVRAVDDVVVKMDEDGTLDALAQKWNLISYEELDK